MNRNDSVSQILTFVAANERYGMNLGEIDEVLFMMSFQDLPNMPSFVKGVINLRGLLIPVLDVCERLSRPRAEIPPQSKSDSVYPKTARMLLLAAKEKQFVLIVDEVERIHAVQNKELHPIQTDTSEARSFLSTMWLDNGVMVPLMEGPKLLADSDWSKLPHSASSAPTNA